MQKDRWSDYHQITSSKPPSKLLSKALAYVKNKENALDLGAGAFVDTKFLLDKGFTVVAVDNSTSSVELSTAINDQKFNFIKSTYDTFNFKPETYDLITAQWALPFNDPKTFNSVFDHLKNSLKIGGIFAGQFFGINDEWNTTEKDMTFHTKDQIQDLLTRMYVIQFREEEKDGITANGNAKHWHVFHVIAEKD